MRECTGTDKPQISILMAIYEPRMDWLREQLLSLDAQTYPNLKLYIRDDCSPTVSYAAIQACVQDCIRAFPYEIQRNERNLGSNGTFERLTQEAEGDYFAYCDQDDIWLPEKLERYEAYIAEKHAELVCSDMYIIDETGTRNANSIIEVRRHHVFKEGANLAPGFLISNFVTGCAMMIRAETAKAAVPFCPYMVHDQYLALWAALSGEIAFLNAPLISYRIHSSNQTLMMAGVQDKDSYYRVRIVKLIDRLSWLQKQFPDYQPLTDEIGRALSWAQARGEAFRGSLRARATVWKYRRFSPLTSLFEICCSWLPDAVFMLFINLKKKNVL